MSDREQCSQVKVTSGVMLEVAQAFLLLLLSSYTSVLTFSVLLTALKIEWHHTLQHIIVILICKQEMCDKCAVQPCNHCISLAKRSITYRVQNQLSHLSSATHST